MSLFTISSLKKTLNLEKLGFIGTFITWSVLKISKLSEINKRYARNQHLSCQEFIDITLKEYGITYRIPEEDLENIPKAGAFVSISNHPFGGIEGLIILKTFHKVRGDYKAIANYLLQNFKPLRTSIIAVNPFDEKTSSKSSLGGLKEAIFHLKQGKPFGVFPAGEVSNIKNGDTYVDIPWNDGIMRLIKKSKVPVVPFYFHGKNSKLFYLLAKIHPLLQTAKLPSELFSQKNKIINIRIGKPISVEKQAAFSSTEEYTAFLRRETYTLSSSFNKNQKADENVTSAAVLNKEILFQK
ncbi:hypothetical protein GCM10022291_25550 [Postechiella marina]|uniref:Phospholipid/glycerol acyltransferase domain-containing protein n=1 Tax=Postechiella marina TaxID=943941 RepID=A0ABP8CCZ7_9FLAO